jgi:hypothetical protein
MINVLRVCELAGKLVIITAGEDECLKIWDTKFNLVHEFNIRKAGLYEKVAASRVK